MNEYQRKEIQKIIDERIKEHETEVFKKQVRQDNLCAWVAIFGGIGIFLIMCLR